MAFFYPKLRTLLYTITDEQKSLREENDRLRAKQEEMLASLGKKQLEVDLLKKKLHLD